MIDGIPEAQARLAKLPDVAERHAKGVVRDGATRVVTAARRHAPVRRGFLRRALEVYVDDRAAVAGLRVGRGGAHWRLLEFGTRKMPAHPVILPAIHQDRAQTDSEMQAAAARAADEI